MLLRSFTLKQNTIGTCDYDYTTWNSVYKTENSENSSEQKEQRCIGQTPIRGLPIWIWSLSPSPATQTAWMKLLKRNTFRRTHSEVCCEAGDYIMCTNMCTTNSMKFILGTKNPAFFHWEKEDADWCLWKVVLGSKLSLRTLCQKTPHGTLSTRLWRWLWKLFCKEPK